MENSYNVPLLSKSIAYATMCEFFEDKPVFIKLDKLLFITKKELNEYGKFNSEEEKLDKNTALYFKKVSWGIRTYLTFQDVFEYDFDFETKDWKTYFKGRYYCYHESLIYLRQIILSILNADSLAAITLIRPFIELSLFNLYWYIKTKSDNKPKSNDWLNDKIGKPPFKDMVLYLKNKIVTKEEKYKIFIERVFTSIECGYSNISIYNHTPKSKESFVKISKASPNVDPGNWIYAIHTINIALYNLITLYIIYFPMILYPIDIPKKFGFNGPMGLFTDKYNYKTLEKYIGPKRCEYLKNLTKENEDIEAKLAWCDSQKDLSDLEILGSYDIENNDKRDLELPIEHLYIKQKSKVRAISLFFSYFNEDDKIEYLSKEESDVFDYLYKEY